MSVISFAEKLKFNGNACIVTYYGKNLLGNDFFCYIKCDMAGYKKIKDDFVNKSYRKLEEYGEIIYRDNIPKPDEKAKEFLKNWKL